MDGRVGAGTSGPDSKEILPPFNGVRDTFFFEVSEDRIFRYVTETKPDGRHRGWR